MQDGVNEYCWPIAHSDRAVGLDRAAEVAVDEFPGEMQAERIDGLDAALRHGRQMQSGEGRDDHEQHHDRHRNRGPAVFDPLDIIGAVVCRRRRGLRHGAIARGRKTRK
jgi:hypothetical protein